MKQYYEQLKGFHITDFFFETDEAGQWPTFTLYHPETGEKVALQLSKDAEGNGAGFGFIMGAKT